jgi:hypothetical protein
VWLALFATPDQLARARAPANALLLGLFLLHYLNRCFVYPLRLRGGKPTPFVVWLLAAVFTAYNGFMQVCDRDPVRRDRPCHSCRGALFSDSIVFYCLPVMITDLAAEPVHQTQPRAGALSQGKVFLD